MTKMMHTFFSKSNNGSGGNAPSSPASVERHMPTTKHAIQQRLATMTEQFDVYKSKYRRAAKDLGNLQNEIIDLRQKLRYSLFLPSFLGHQPQYAQILYLLSI